MILVSFLFSHRVLSIGIGREVTEIAQTDKQTHIARLIFKDIKWLGFTLKKTETPVRFKPNILNRTETEKNRALKNRLKPNRKNLKTEPDF